MQQIEPRILIRQVNADDADAVSAVLHAAFAPVRSIYRPLGEVVARQAERARHGTRLVAEYEGRIVGTVQYDDHDDHVHIVGLAVHPHFHRLGIARCLIDRIAEIAPTVGQHRIALDTIKETGNVAIFEKLGFRTFSESVTDSFVSDQYPKLHEVRMERSTL